MTPETSQAGGPPSIRPRSDGKPDPTSVADLLEWFLANDERTARMRLPDTDELFKWKQADDEASGVGIYPFENAEARFAIGAMQALETNDSEPLLKLWISDLLEALQDAHTNKTEIAEAYKLGDDISSSTLERAAKLTTTAEKRLYLTSCWLEVLCTAEARVLGWIYQEIYGRPYAT